MEKVECSNCSYKLVKPTLEILIHTVKKAGGNILEDICPECKKDTLKLNLNENDSNVENCE